MTYYDYMSHTKDDHTQNVHHLGMPHETKAHAGRSREKTLQKQLWRQLLGKAAVLVISPRESAVKVKPNYL